MQTASQEMLRMHFCAEFHFLYFFSGYLRPNCVDKLRVWHSTCETDTNLGKGKAEKNSSKALFMQQDQKGSRTKIY